MDWQPCDGSCYNWSTEFFMYEDGWALFESQDPHYTTQISWVDGYYKETEPACGRLDIEVGTTQYWGVWGISGLRALCSGLYCHGTECFTGPRPMVNNFDADYVHWNPCNYGPFRYVAEYDFEEEKDYLHLHCIYHPWPEHWECPERERLTGNRIYTGYYDAAGMFINVITDETERSAGLKSLRAECEGVTRTADGEEVWVGAPMIPCEDASQFPSCDPNDGKFLNLSGIGFATHPSTKITLYIEVEAGEEEFSVEIFDGDHEPPFDYTHISNTNRTCFRLTADLWQNGTGSYVIREMYNDSMSNNAFTTLYSGPVHDQAMNPNHNYFYRLDIVSGPDCDTPDDIPLLMNSFKVRSSSQVSLISGGINFRASDASGPYIAPNPWSAAGEDTDFDGAFDFFIDVPEWDISLYLQDADADYLLDESAPGNAMGANKSILFVVYDPDGKRKYTNFDPSGDHDELAGVYDIEAIGVSTGRVGGSWRWRWENVWTENEIRIWTPTSSPAAFNVYSAPVRRLSVTSARSKGYWKNHSEAVAPLLPVLLGQQDISGTPIGSSILVTSTQQARDIFVGTHGHVDRGTRAMEHLLMQLLAAKLNVKAVLELGEQLESAYVYGSSDLVVGEVINDADVAVAGVSDPSTLSNPEIVELRDRLSILDAINNGGVTYMQPIFDRDLEINHVPSLSTSGPVIDVPRE